MGITRLRLAFAGIAIILTTLWLLSLPDSALTAGFWPVRRTLINFTGVLAIGFMSASIVLAARPVQIEPLLGGLDKFYRLHKWLGIGAAAIGLVHWLLEIVPRWMVGQGWLAPPVRRAGGGPAGANPFADWHGIGAEVGEWGFYLLLVLVVIALWKRFPYHLFFKTHRLMAVVYLLLAFHAIVLMPPAYWTAPIGPATAVLLAGGSAAAVISLFRRIGHSRRAVGRVEYFKQYFGNAVLEVGVRFDTAWPGHQAGQFAFVRFEGREGAHPFTISSAWRQDGQVVFRIKGLGDYTRALPEMLRVGQTVTVEGPYGRFDFRGKCSRQLWIGGGIGITPFIAGLQARAAATDAAVPVDLIYSTSAPDAAFIDNIRQLAEQAGVRFHLLVTPQDGLLTLDRLAAILPQWKEADIWFCGPAGFGQSLYDAMTARGLPPRQFHRELFDMR